MGLFNTQFQRDAAAVTPASGRLEKDAMLLGINGPVKRAIDVCVSLTLIAFLLPVLILVSVAVKMGGGPLLYKQARIGRDGQLFNMLKFRSMYVDAEKRLDDILKSDPAHNLEWSQFQKLKHDPRITKVGHILRKSSLDELPQLFNVLKGDMSLVGQRPILPKQRDAYGVHIKGYERARPGLTGLWQVSGRNMLTFNDRAELGSVYINTWTLGQDIKILTKTIPAVLFSKNAF